MECETTDAVERDAKAQSSAAAPSKLAASPGRWWRLSQTVKLSLRSSAAVTFMWLANQTLEEGRSFDWSRRQIAEAVGHCDAAKCRTLCPDWSLVHYFLLLTEVDEHLTPGNRGLTRTFNYIAWKAKGLLIFLWFIRLEVHLNELERYQGKDLP